MARGLAREVSYLWGSVNIEIMKMTTTGGSVYSFYPNDINIRDLAYDGTCLWMINPNGVIRKFTTDGVFVDSITGLLSGGWGLTYENDYLWASDPNTDMIYKISMQSSTDIEESIDVGIRTLHLSAYPNPFREKTVIRFQIPDARCQNPDIRHLTSNISLRIYDVGGRLVRTLPIPDNRIPITEVVWDGRNERGEIVGNNIYFYHVILGDRKAVGKLILLR